VSQNVNVAARPNVHDSGTLKPFRTILDFAEGETGTVRVVNHFIAMALNVRQILPVPKSAKLCINSGGLIQNWPNWSTHPNGRN
jgi:hypothetical protein